MSLEQNVAALTAAVVDLTTALRASGAGAQDASATLAAFAATVPASTDPAPPKRGPGRPPKNPQIPAPEAQDFGPANEGDVNGTAYYACDAHNTVAKFAPTDSLSAVSDRTKWVQVTGAEYLAKRAALAERFPTSAVSTPAAAPPTPTAAPAPSAAPAASDPPSNAQSPTFASVQDALLAVAKNDPAKGRERIVKALAVAGVKVVSQLVDKPADVLAAVLAAASAVETDPLFG